MLEVVL
jgi:hypothetical protein